MREELEWLGEKIAVQAAQIDAAMHGLLTDLRGFDLAGGWYAQGARSAAHWLSWRVGWSFGTAREHVRVAHALGTLPKIDDALRRGAISYSKVRAMTRVATAENEELLLTYARYAPAAQLETICQKFACVQALATKDPNHTVGRRAVQRRTLEDGMAKLDAILLPDELAIVWKAIARAGGKADGLVKVAEAYLRGDQPDTAPVEMVITVPAETLVGTSAEPAMTEDGTHVPAESSRRLACDCGIVALAENARGEALSIGRKSRTIPTAIKRAMLERDQHRCRFPGCTAKAFLDGHHIEHWVNGGETSLENLVSLCGHHHTCVHELGFTVAREDGDLVFRNPHGRVVSATPPRSLRRWTPNPEITGDTNRCLWDGAPVNLRYCVDALYAQTFPRERRSS